jgi:hypothetical protein
VAIGWKVADFPGDEAEIVMNGEGALEGVRQFPAMFASELGGQVRNGGINHQRGKSTELFERQRGVFHSSLIRR